LDLQALLVLQGRKVYKAILAQLDLKVCRVSKVFKAFKALLDLLAHKGRRVLLEPQAQLVAQATQAL
jgi:hypothetical protein